MTTNKDKAATKKPLINKKNGLKSNDKKMDTDFPQFQSEPSKENTDDDKNVHVGSGGAFEGTEEVRD